MTIKDCIDIVDNIKPNQYTIKDKVMWLSFIEEIIINEVLKTHEGYDGRYDLFEGYTEDKLSVTLIVPSPYDRLYTAYLKMKIDQENGEIARYNNSMVLYDTYMLEFRKHYNKTHMPLDATSKRNVMPLPKATVGLSDAEYENLKKDMTFILTEYFSDSVSADKLYDIVTKYAQNNVEMLKGKNGKDGVDGEDGYTPRKNIDYFDGAPGRAFTYKDFTPEQLESLKGEPGYTPKKGVDYYTSDDKAEMKSYLNRHIDEQTEVIKSDVEGLQKQINEEAHFRGYLSTNAKIQTLEATPNDFVYSAESGTKWVYDEINGWINTNIPVPDQLTPASNAMPLINGEASVGNSEEYARGDHRHPTDTTRASAEELNNLKDSFEEQIGDIETALDNIIAIQNNLLGVSE